MKIAVAHGTACYDDHVPPGLNGCHQLPEGCPDQPLGSIALHRCAYSPTSNHPKTGGWKVIGYNNQHNKRVRKSLSDTPHPLEVG